MVYRVMEKAVMTGFGREAGGRRGQNTFSNEKLLQASTYGMVRQP